MQAEREIKTLRFFKKKASQEVLDFAKKGSYLKKDKGNQSFSIASVDEERKVTVKVIYEIKSNMFSFYWSTIFAIL